MKPLRILYPTVIVIAGLYLAAAGGLYFAITHGLTMAEIIFGVVTYILGGFGITALYHRSWTHNAVQFQPCTEMFLAICSVFTLQNTARDWVGNHFRHHQYTDRDGDPHNIHNGFYWAHEGWMFFNTPLDHPRLPDRLEHNVALNFQTRYYYPLSLLLNIALPALIAYASGHPWWAGLLLNALRLLVLNQIIFCVNSLCHSVGKQPFSKVSTARDVWWFPFMLGEQYHNYHHAFPRDYRNGIAAHDFDPTKWFIWAAYKLGLAQAPFKMAPERIAAARQSTQGRVL